MEFRQGFFTASFATMVNKDDQLIDYLRPLLIISLSVPSSYPKTDISKMDG